MTVWMKKCRDVLVVVEGQQRKSRPRKIWYQLMNSDSVRSLKIDRDLAQNQTEWKIAVLNPCKHGKQTFKV